jgi:Ca2+-transporting ATPase
MERINVFEGILKNYVFTAVLTCTTIFQIIIVEFLGTYANTSPLSLKLWFVSVFLGVLGMPIGAAIKMIPVGSV